MTLASAGGITVAAAFSCHAFHFLKNGLKEWQLLTFIQAMPLLLFGPSSFFCEKCIVATTETH